MLNFSVQGKPIPQGSMSAFVPVAPNADIAEAIEWTRIEADSNTAAKGWDKEAARLHAVVDRLEAIGKWPTYQKHGPDAKTPGHFVASMHASNATELKHWRDKIAAAAREAYDGPQLFMPLSVKCDFDFARPAAHWRTGKRSDELHMWAPMHHTSMPDRDKLLRAVLDALTQSKVIWDDKIVAETPGRNWWSDVKGGGDGVRIVIAELPESTACRAWARKRYERRKQ